MTGNKFDIDIEIKDLLWEFLRKWRTIVVLAVICGVGLTAYQYRSDLASATVTTVKKSQEELEASMAAQDIDEVIGAVALKRQLDQKSAYMDASELMQINPYEENAVLMQYYVSAEESTKAEEAAALYEDFVEKGYLADMLAKTGGYELEAAYLGELISIINEESNLYINAENATESIQMTVIGNDKEASFNIKVCGKDMEAALRLADGVKAAMQEYIVTAASAAGAHQLRLIQETNQVIVDQGLAELQNWNATAIKTISNNIDKMKNEMTSDQITLYTYRTVLGAAEEAGITTTVKEVSISMKHGIIGVILGIVLACVIIFAQYFFAAALRSAEEVKKLYQIKVLGNINDSAFEKKKIFGFIDRLLLKLQNMGKKKLSYEQQLQMACANIAIDCKKNNTSEICLASSIGDYLPQAVVNDLVKKCKEKGVAVKVVSDMAYDAEALEAAAQNGSVIFVEKKRKSFYDELYKEISLCKENDIYVLGMVVLGE